MKDYTKRQTIMVWILTVIIAFASIVYQRITGPTRPVRGSLEIGDKELDYKLPRSEYSSSDAHIILATGTETISGEIKWRRQKSHDDWQVDSLNYTHGELTAKLPKQPPAGKIAYMISLIDETGQKYDLTAEPVVIRFKGDVPILLLLPHVLLMVISMIMGARTGFEALFKREYTCKWALWTSAMFFLGGLVLGPIVQKLAFEAYWTGWPLGIDLTDNKTALAMLLWIIALWRGKDMTTGRKWFIIAAAFQLLVYLIPHSMFGSEFDYTQSNR